MSGNRLQGLQGNGIAIETLLISAKIEHNVLNTIGKNGLIMLPGSAAGSMKVLGNELINIAASETTKRKSQTEIAAIYLREFRRRGLRNAISAVGNDSPLAPSSPESALTAASMCE